MPILVVETMFDPICCNFFTNKKFKNNTQHSRIESNHYSCENRIENIAYGRQNANRNTKCEITYTQKQHKTFKINRIVARKPPKLSKQQNKVTSFRISSGFDNGRNL
jgi:hypothetical protein